MFEISSFIFHLSFAQHTPTRPPTHSTLNFSEDRYNTHPTSVLILMYPTPDNFLFYKPRDISLPRTAIPVLKLRTIHQTECTEGMRVWYQEISRTTPNRHRVGDIGLIITFNYQPIGCNNICLARWA